MELLRLRPIFIIPVAAKRHERLLLIHLMCRPDRRRCDRVPEPQIHSSCFARPDWGKLRRQRGIANPPPISVHTEQPLRCLADAELSPPQLGYPSTSESRPGSGRTAPADSGDKAKHRRHGASRDQHKDHGIHHVRCKAAVFLLPTHHLLQLQAVDACDPLLSAGFLGGWRSYSTRWPAAGQVDSPLPARTLRRPTHIGLRYNSPRLSPLKQITAWSPAMIRDTTRFTGITTGNPLAKPPVRRSSS